jgi:hypothetical protein
MEKKDKIDLMFDRIKILTAILIEEFTIEQFHDVMRERSDTVNLLKLEVENERARVLEENRLHFFEQRIEMYLRQIKEMDAKVIALIKSKMNDILSEMGTLSRNSSAALAYTSHRRM